MKNITKNINRILAEWDPLDVGGDAALDEYQGYVPEIMKYIGNRDSLNSCLENILINDLEVGYDKGNQEHRKTLAEIVEKIIILSPDSSCNN